MALFPQIYSPYKTDAVVSILLLLTDSEFLYGSIYLHHEQGQ